MGLSAGGLSASALCAKVRNANGAKCQGVSHLGTPHSWHPVLWHSDTLVPIYRTVTVTGLNCIVTGAPSGVLATPLTCTSEPPGPTASKISAASSPAPEAPD